MLQKLIYILITLSTLQLTQVVAQEDLWSNVFKFQTKMATSGNVSAQYILGEMYEEGRGVKQNFDTAIEWYKKAQRKGHNDAAGRIAKIKDNIAKVKLKKKTPVIKITKVKKKPSIIKAKPDKPIMKKMAATKIESRATIKSAKKKPSSPPPIKKRRPAGSPEDYNRIVGSSLDTAEDSFE